MIQAVCMVQEGQIPPQTEENLRSGLGVFSEKAFGEPVEIQWVTIPERSGFTAGKPSTSSIVSVTSNKVLERPERKALLMELCDFWMAETKCSLDEVVGVINDPAA